MNSSGLSIQPSGAPVLRVKVLEVLLLTQTDWGLLVRKSRIQIQNNVLGHYRKCPDQLNHCLVWELQSLITAYQSAAGG